MNLGLASLFKGIADLVKPVDDRAELTPEIARKLASLPGPHVVFAKDLLAREQVTLAEYAGYNGGIIRYTLADNQVIFCDSSVSRTYRVGHRNADFLASVGMYGMVIPSVTLGDVLPRLAGPASDAPRSVFH
jgi:hypothetical protein